MGTQLRLAFVVPILGNLQKPLKNNLNEHHSNDLKYLSAKQAQTRAAHPNILRMASAARDEIARSVPLPHSRKIRHFSESAL
jgi:hypothetical protein